jgi:hypothetical protein
LNAEGGVLKVSPDGGLRQSSTVADTWQCTFKDGATANVPGALTELAVLRPAHTRLESELAAQADS